MKRNRFIVIIIMLFSTSVMALSLSSGEPRVIAGISQIEFAQSQHIGVLRMLGNDYTIVDSSKNKGVFGLGYLLSKPFTNDININYGIEAFYFSTVKTHGNVYWETIFHNLNFEYELSNLPVYAVLESEFLSDNPDYSFVINGGAGVNHLKTKNYHEKSLDNNFSLPDYAFHGKSSNKFSVMA